MADDDDVVDATDEFWGSVGGMPLEDRLWSLKYQPAISGFPDPKDPDRDDQVWFGV